MSILRGIEPVTTICSETFINTTGRTTGTYLHNININYYSDLINHWIQIINIFSRFKSYDVIDKLLTDEAPVPNS